MLVLKREKLPINPFFDAIWRKSTYLEAYREPENALPPVTSSEIHGMLPLEPLSVNPQRGRPKKGARKPSFAKDYGLKRKKQDEEQEEKKERKTQCGNCKSFGHNKRSCRAQRLDSS